MFNRITNLLCVALLAALLPASVISARGALSAEADMQHADEMLQDGLEALGDDERDLAQQLFETLIETYPGSKESQRAERELVKLGVTPSRVAAQAPRLAPQDPLPMRADTATALRLKFATEVGDRVFFAENSAVIGGRARAMLETQARWFAKRAPLRITIVGRADDSAPADASNALSIQRAEAVRERLIAAGVPATRIAIEGRGTRDPVANCRTPLCQAQNRHAETLISSGVMQSERVDERARGGGAGSGATMVAR